VGAHAADINATSRIDAVTVYPAGAEIARTAKVKIDRGEHTLLFKDLPAEAVASSIRVEGKASGKLEIGSVDTRTVSVPRADDAAAASERRKLEDAIEKLKDDKSALQASVLAAETQKKLIDNLTQLPSRPVPAGTAAPLPDWSQLFGLIGERAAEAQKAILATQIKIREVERQIRDLEGRLVSLAPTKVARTEVKVFVGADTALEADIVIRYQVRNASWTPFYDARLATGTKAAVPKLQLVRRASIQQRTGEVWDNVVLALSTARPAAGTAAPVLMPMVVDYESEVVPPRPMARSAKPPPPAGGVVAEAVESATASAKAAQETVAAEDRRATIEIQAFQAVYGIPGRVTVPDTGETKRVQIDDMQLDPALTVRTVPKREAKAYLYAKFTTARGTPLLAGQVSLFRDATFVGNGRLPLLAPGEEHELGFGVDDAVRVRYAVAEEKRGETGIISTSKTDDRSYRITLKSLHGRPVQVSVLDQIPVSQNAEIKVELTGKTAPSRRDVDDKRGVLAWDFQLAPDEERSIDFGYRTTWPSAKKVTYGQGS
jgi:uncharacterized protein (TIGR02231 family)